MQSRNPLGNTCGGMGGAAIQVGDRVVGTQIPGVFTVLDRRGPLVEIESERGLRMTVVVSSLRKLDGETPVPKDD